MDSKILHELKKKNLVLHIEQDRVWYALERSIPRANMHGLFPRGFLGPYMMARVEDYRPVTGELRISPTLVKITMQDRGIWLTHNNEFFSQIPIKYIFI